MSLAGRLTLGKLLCPLVGHSWLFRWDGPAAVDVRCSRCGVEAWHR